MFNQELHLSLLANQSRSVSSAVLSRAKRLGEGVHTFCVSSFFSCFSVSVRLTSLSMASTCVQTHAIISHQVAAETCQTVAAQVRLLTCRFRCFRYIPQALQNASSSRPKRRDTVLLCISDLSAERKHRQRSHRCSKERWRAEITGTRWRKRHFSHFRCQKKKCPIL